MSSCVDIYSLRAGDLSIPNAQPVALLLDICVVSPAHLGVNRLGNTVLVGGRRTRWYLSYGPQEPMALLELFQK